MARKLIKVKAKIAFTKTTRNGQFHGDPDSKRNSRPMVPEELVDELVAAGYVERLKGKEAEAEAEAEPAEAEAAAETGTDAPAEAEETTAPRRGGRKTKTDAPAE